MNTSFNVRGEPIVCQPDEAFQCFMGTDLDVLAVENFLLFKEEQVIQSTREYMKNYELD